MENKSFIKNVKVNDGLTITQFIDVNTDAVSFTNYDTDETLFIIDSSTYTGWIKPGTTEEIAIGKFSYEPNYDVKFTFNDSFLAKYPDIKSKTILTTLKEFIEAEQMVIKELLLTYPGLFLKE